MTRSLRTTLLAIALSAGPLATAQMYLLNPQDTLCHVTNNGLVAGYDDSEYFTWTLLGGKVGHGGVIPGNGNGGWPMVSVDGTRLGATALNTVTNKSEMAYCDLATNQWTLCGSLGFAVDSGASSGFCMSADGTVQAGNAWVPGARAHAVVYSNGTMTDLGTGVPDRSTRVDAMSADGSVLGGYQEMTDGYWAASVWIGGTQYLPTYGGEPLQQVGDISDNGQYAVGGGGYATEGRAYLWNKDTGVTLLDNPFAADGWELRATCVNEDGTVVIGVGQNFWFERMGWIWTPQTGTVSLESFAAQYPGYNGEYLMGPTSISPNGQYITGWGVDAMGFSAVSFVIQRWATLTPTSTSIGLGSIVSGDNGSLASDDGNALKICKAFVPSVSAPRIRFDSDFTSPYAAASKVEVTLKARMTTGGAFKVRTFVADRTGNSYAYSPASQVVADTSLGLSFGTFSGSSLIPSMTIGPDMTMRARVEIQQTGFSAVAVPCAEFEKLNLTVTP